MNCRLRILSLVFAAFTGAVLSLPASAQLPEHPIQPSVFAKDIPPFEFGTVSIDLTTARWMSRAISERQTLAELRTTRAQSTLRFRPGAPGSYRVIVQGQGHKNKGTVTVRVVIRAQGFGGLIESEGTASESWPLSYANSPDLPTSYPQAYPRIKSTYTPRDKNGRRIITSQREKWESRQTRDKNVQQTQEMKSAYLRALARARHKAEEKIKVSQRTD